MQRIEIVDTTDENIRDYGICGYSNIKRPGYLEKIEWLKKRYSEGMKIKTLYAHEGGTQGMIEYIPGEYCWRPVDARGYMFIHCIFVGFKREYKQKGYATLLLKECIQDAQQKSMHGVAAVTRKGAFMAGKELFMKNGFTVVDSAAPDFELLSMKFAEHAPPPKFKGDWETRTASYGDGLAIIRADQCPYTVKNVVEIVEAAKGEFGLQPKVFDLKSHEEAQQSPSPFGNFCIVYNGEVIAHHPISRTRFVNIMKKMLP
jgi:hypothetical protein